MPEKSEPLWDGVSFAKVLGERLDKHLLERGAIGVLAAGSAFEHWLALEARLLIEKDRDGFGVGGNVPNFDRAMPRVWVACEFRKVDLVLQEFDEKKRSSPTWAKSLVCCEFKLVYNNKNWPAQVRSIARDFRGASGKTAKQALKPRSRIAIICVVAKDYWYPGDYQHKSFSPKRGPTLEQALQDELPPACWTGAQHRIATTVGSDRQAHESPWLKPDGEQFLQLRAYHREGSRAAAR